MRKQLTETAIGAATRKAAESKKRVELADAGLPGLRLRITPRGARAWILGMRDRQGDARRFSLGEYPTLSISEAREAARTLRQSVREGADPIAERRRDRGIAAAARRGEGTLRAVLDAYGEDAGAALRSWPHSRLRVERVFADYLDKPAVTLALPDLLLAADRYAAKASAAFAVRTLRPVLKWAALRKLVPAVLALIQRRDPQRRRQRILGEDELALLLPALRTSTRPHAAALRLMLLTLARREEVCSARWCDVDLRAGLWSIPGQVTKNRQPHIVPLSRQAVAELAARKPATAAMDALVFAVQGRPKPESVIPDAEPAAPRRRRRVKGGTKQESNGPMMALGNWDRETKALQEASGTTGWHRHDLRRTGATMLGELGELPDIVEAALNHVAIRSPLAATYNQARYRPQVAVALQRLADTLDTLEQRRAQPKR
jgi:integrase